MNGTAIALSQQFLKAMYVNDMHFTENLATIPSSYILPKGSPLEVSKCKCSKLINPIYLSLSGYFKA